MTTDKKFQPLIDELTNSLKAKQQKTDNEAKELEEALKTFRPIAQYLTELAAHLAVVKPGIQISPSGKLRKQPDKQFVCHYDVFMDGQRRKTLVFTMQGQRIQWDQRTFLIDDQTALEDALGRTIVDTLKV